MAKQRSAGLGADAGMGADPLATGPGGAAGEQGGVMDQAKEKAQQLAGQAKEQTTQRVQSGLAQGKTRAASSLGAVAETLRQSTQQLRDQNQAGVGQYVEQAADQVQRLAQYLESTDVHEMIDGVERVARRQPALFLGSAFALGLLGARFLKNSRRGRVDERYGRGYEGYRGADAYGGAPAGAPAGYGAYGAAAGSAAPGIPGATTGSAYGGASSLDRDVTGSRGVGTDALRGSSTAGGVGTGGAGIAGGTDYPATSGLGSAAGGLGSTGGLGSAGTSPASLDPDSADRRL